MTVIQILLLSLIFFFTAYSLLRKNKVVLNIFERLIIFIGPIFLTSIFSLIPVVKYGGTIKYASYGWPHFFYMHQMEDVIDRTMIDRWHFISGGFFSYPISNYLFYFSLIFLLIVSMKMYKK